MSEQTKSNGDSFTWWGLFLIAFPLIAGTAFTIWGYGEMAAGYLPFILIVTYVLWGWVFVVGGIMMMVKGARMSNKYAASSQDTEG